MGEFLIECTICGVSFGSEKKYDSHPCMSEDIKVPFKIKMEQDEEETELEEEVQKAIDEAASSCKMEIVSTTSIKDEPIEDYDDVDPLKVEENEEEEEEEFELPDALPDDPPEVEGAEEETATIGSNECLVCGKKFFRREDYLAHKMNSHKVPRPYECKLCKKTFTQKHYVALHMRVHTGERPYKCTLCSNTYTHKTSFTIHMRIHNGDRPYRCGICGKRCYDKSGLTSHMRSHTKETPYECEVCGRRFTHSKSLLVHRRNHTGEKPYKCMYCGKCFRHWHKHKIHVRLHTGERPYRCKVCGKGFPRNDEVKRHMRSHQGIKSFKCSICSVYCATQASITGHIDLHHSDLKPNNPTAPEKTLVKDSKCGTLGTKAPQPRTIYKRVTNEDDLGSTAVDRSIMVSKTGSDGKPKQLSYKEYLELQEQLLIKQGLKVKEAKSSTAVTASIATTSTTSKPLVQDTKMVTANGTRIVQKSIFTKDGKQIMIVSPQPKQSGTTSSGGLQLVVPNSSGASTSSGYQLVMPKQISTATTPLGTVLTNTINTTTQPIVSGSQLILNQPGTGIIQPQILGGGGGQQLILLSSSINQQNGLSQPLLLLTGNPGGGVAGGQRLVLLPKQSAGQAQPVVNAGGQLVVLPTAPNVANAPQIQVSNSATSVFQVKQEPTDPTAEVGNNTQVGTLKTVIKQEPGVAPVKTIKEEPVDVDPLSSANTNITIKQEPQDTYE